MEELIDLDECVINALDLQKREKLPKIKIPFKNPLIVGSGNAAAVGKLLFPGIHANESNYLEKIKSGKVDGCVIISASAGKHSPKIAKKIKKFGLKTILLTNNPEGKATKFATKTYVFPKNIEPYTYNTSTYLGMILSQTKEDPEKILKFLKSIKVPNNLKKYNSYMFILPERFDSMREFYETKFDELFGPKIQGKAFTFEEAKHAKTVVKSDKQLFISLGRKNRVFGKNRLDYNFPSNASFGLVFCLGYYIIGKIQSQNPPWFKQSIKRYVREASKLFKEKIRIKS